ncbi:unnamed protein product [Lactuca saligna]|uniref:Uncharacterized protein n=1 Tax=Lactuca saligna TaxID=75948 RepID=A0AA36ELZ5_LACSI|nr:unnamed protein product [Lactuca saligna]
MALLVSMISSHGVIPTSEYLETLQKKYDFQLEDIVLLPLDGATFLEPPLVKIGVYVNTLDVRYQLLNTGFLNKLLRKNEVKVYDLTPNVVNKVVAFEMCVDLEVFFKVSWWLRNFFVFLPLVKKLLSRPGSSHKNWKIICSG